MKHCWVEWIQWIRHSSTNFTLTNLWTTNTWRHVLSKNMATEQTKVHWASFYVLQPNGRKEEKTASEKVWVWHLKQHEQQLSKTKQFHLDTVLTVQVWKVDSAKIQCVRTPTCTIRTMCKMKTLQMPSLVARRVWTRNGKWNHKNAQRDLEQNAGFSSFCCRAQMRTEWNIHKSWLAWRKWMQRGFKVVWSVKYVWHHN